MSEASSRTDFSRLRYAQCWEDAEVLLEGLALRPGATVVSIASGGDNTLALLTRPVERVVAIDLGPAQLACLALKVAAFGVLEHAELLELVGSVSSARRPELYLRCRPALSDDARRFWDAHPKEVARGIGHAGKLERYMRHLRRWVLPAIHSPRTVEALFVPRAAEERRRFHDEVWANRRWRALIGLALSRGALSRGGRDPGFYRYAESNSEEALVARVARGLSVLDASDNPYLAWTLLGRHDGALPVALRPESFESIRAQLERLEIECISLETFLDRAEPRSVDGFNLSNVFEYVSIDAYHALLKQIAIAGRSGARVAYWNFLVQRTAPAELSRSIRPLAEIAEALTREDKTFCNAAFVLDEVV